MRTTHSLLGLAAIAATLGAGMLQTQAAEPAKARPVAVCKQTSTGNQCVAVKRIRAEARVVPVQTTKANLDLQVCDRLQSQLERDTCLNHVEASA